jgi:DNA-binding NtrC family response regulator
MTRPRFEARSSEAQQRLSQQSFDLVITDLSMPGADGFEVLRAVRELRSGLPVIVLTALSSTAECVRAMRGGAVDFVGKPFDQVQFKETIRAALRSRPPITATDEDTPDEAHLPLAALIGESPKLQEAIEQVERVAQGDTAVLLIGEQGTGKQAVARLLHAMSRRVGRSLITLRCSADEPEQLAQVLFGNADNATASPADGGTLLLTNLERLDTEPRERRIRELARHAASRSGASRRADVRVLVSIDTDQVDESDAHGLIETLQQALEAVVITMPPLREREQDVPLLIEYFTETANRRFGRRANAHSLVTALKQYPWPGNLTELEARVSQFVTEAPPELQDEPVAPANAFVVPIDRVSATLILDDGSQREVVLPRGQGQAMEELFEAREAFIPVREGGSTCIYARNALACVVVSDAGEPEDDALPHKERRVRVTLQSGVVLEGELRYVAVEGRGRVTDVLNESSPSFSLHAGATVRHIAKAHVRSIEEC